MAPIRVVVLRLAEGVEQRSQIRQGAAPHSQDSNVASLVRDSDLALRERGWGRIGMGMTAMTSGGQCLLTTRSYHTADMVRRRAASSSTPSHANASRVLAAFRQEHRVGFGSKVPSDHMAPVVVRRSGIDLGASLIGELDGGQGRRAVLGGWESSPSESSRKYRTNTIPTRRDASGARGIEYNTFESRLQNNRRPFGSSIVSAEVMTDIKPECSPEVPPPKTGRLLCEQREYQDILRV